MKEKGATCTEGPMDKDAIKKYLHEACQSKDNLKSAFERFCKKQNKGKYKCSKSWKCKTIGCMGCAQHDCIVEGVKTEITEKEVSGLMSGNTGYYCYPFKRIKFSIKFI